MRARLPAGTVIAMTWLVLAPSVATASSPASTLRAPYENDSAIGSVGPISRDCGAMHSLDSGAPNATTGRLHLGEGVAVEDCTAGEGLTYFWSLGDVSSSLVGKPVIVTASVKVRAFTRAASGSGDREASVSLSIGDDAWTLVSIACNDNGCARGGRARHRNAVLVLRTRMNEAPSTMLLSLDAFAFASGTGSVEASLDATLTSVRIRRA